MEARFALRFCCWAARTCSSVVCAKPGNTIWSFYGKSVRSSCRHEQNPEDLVKVPKNALHYAALGAIEFGKMEDEATGCYVGTECLTHYVRESRKAGTRRQGEPGLISSQFELLEFRSKYSRKPFVAANFSAGAAELRDQLRVLKIADAR